MGNAKESINDSGKHDSARAIRAKLPTITVAAGLTAHSADSHCSLGAAHYGQVGKPTRQAKLFALDPAVICFTVESVGVLDINKVGVVTLG